MIRDDVDVEGRSRAADPGLAARAFLVAVCLLWGGNVVAIRLTLVDLPPFLTATLRFAIAAAALVAWGATRRGYLRPPDRSLGPIGVLVVLTSTVFGLLHIALKLAPASQVAILLYLYPFFTLLLAHFCLPEETMSLRALLGLGLAFTGASLTVLGPQHDALPSGVLGGFLAVCSAFVWGLSTVWTKRLLSTVHTYSLILYSTLGTAILLGVLSMAVETHEQRALSRVTVLALAYQGVIAGAACSIVWISVMKTLRASTISSYTFLSPVFGVLASWLLLQEPVRATLLLGLTLVALGLVLIDRPLGPRSASQARRTP